MPVSNVWLEYLASKFKLLDAPARSSGSAFQLLLSFASTSKVASLYLGVAPRLVWLLRA